MTRKRVRDNIQKTLCEGCPYCEGRGHVKSTTTICYEILRDIKNYELEFRIEELESKFSQDLSETTFNEIRELKKLQKIN